MFRQIDKHVLVRSLCNPIKFFFDKLKKNFCQKKKKIIFNFFNLFYRASEITKNNIFILLYLVLIVV